MNHSRFLILYLFTSPFLCYNIIRQNNFLHERRCYSLFL
nr:MAG TPA: hypothetical protein [Caudoviricetes sp.]